MTQPIRVLIADDSVRARAGLRTLLATEPDLAVVGEACNGQDAVRLVAECHPAVVLMDLQMPIMDGAEATRLIKRSSPDVVIVVVTAHAVDQAFILATGADALVIKGDSPERLIAALRVGYASGKA